MKFLSTLFWSLLIFQGLQAQNNFWTEVADRQSLPPISEGLSVVQHYQPLALDYEAIQQALMTAPMEFSQENSPAFLLSLPLPDGRTEVFQVVESPILAPELAARYPEIKTYRGYSTSNAAITTRLDVGPVGFHAIITLPQGRVIIEPYAPQQTRYYAAYFVKDVETPAGIRLECGYVPGQAGGLEHSGALETRDVGLVSLKKYTIGLACSGEFADYHNASTKAQVLAQMTQIINFANEFMVRDLAVRLEIAANTDAAIFLDPATDPYTDGSSVMESFAQTAEILNANLGIDNYDLGHSFIAGCSSGTVGIGRGRACNNQIAADEFKGFGISCQYSGNSSFAVQLVCHEVGHQLSASHTFNNCPDAEGAVTASSAYEPGSGSTIMSYAGSCGDQNILMNSDAYYHTQSIEQIRTYTQSGLGSTCAESIPTSNSDPSVNLPYENGFFIPVRTPFELTAEGADPDGDALTYCWEEYDLGPTSPIGNPSLDAPIFRSVAPTSSPNRVFPSLLKIVNNQSNNNEVLPTYNRNLTFRCTVRDNDPEAGGVNWAQVQFKADQTAGPFLVTAPNTGDVTWKVGEYREVTWNVANTTNPRVKCHYVNIKLSVDGGFTYPYTLAASTPNDGSAFVSVPDAVTADARVRVEAANNIFFDISNADFTIAPASGPGFAIDVSPVAVPLFCTSQGNITFDITTAPLLGYDSTITLSLLGSLPANGSYAFGQNSLTPGESTTLTLELPDYTGHDTLQLQVSAEGPGLGATNRSLYIIAVSSDFSSLQLMAPADGTSDIVLSTNFSWTSAPNATLYDFQLATSPAFGVDDMVESAEGLSAPGYTPTQLFEENTLYFWRVRPINECGPGEWLPPFAFHTAIVDCANTAANDLPINIANNPNTKISKINIPTDGIISDLNLTNVEVTFQPVNSLRIFLVSPAGTEVRLWNLDCLNTGLIRLGFDDEAPTEITCPPDDNLPVRPDQPLSAFDGENTAGEWQLKVQVVTSGFGSGGTIKSWRLEFCAAVATTPPTLITNETLAVPPGEGNTITKQLLEVQDDVATPSQVTYTIVTPPAHGQLYRWSLNEPLGAGAHFSQSTINTYNLVYVHDGSATQTDAFTFIAEDNEGGWLPTQVFNIDIDEGATVSVKDVVAANAISLAPNPTSESVRINFRKALSGGVSVQLLNLQGQQVLQGRYADGNTPIELNTAQLPAGAYFVQVRTEQGMFTEKLVVQHR